jgi:hypothetical protein
MTGYAKVAALLTLIALSFGAVACGNDAEDDLALTDTDDGNTRTTGGTPEEGGAPPGSRAVDRCLAPIAWENAREYLDVEISFVGPVAGASRQDIGEDEFLFLEVGNQLSSENGIDVVIPDYAVARFIAPPEETLTGEFICVTGVIQEGDEGGRLRTFIGGPEDITRYTLPPPTPAPPGGSCDGPISWDEAPEHVGERLPVEGPVVSVRIDEESYAEPLTLLALGRPGDEEGGVDIAIPESALGNFEAPPEELYADKTICVDGAIVEVDGRYRVFVQLPQGIFIRE